MLWHCNDLWKLEFKLHRIDKAEDYAPTRATYLPLSLFLGLPPCIIIVMDPESPTRVTPRMINFVVAILERCLVLLTIVCNILSMQNLKNSARHLRCRCRSVCGLVVGDFKVCTVLFCFNDPFSLF